MTEGKRIQVASLWTLHAYIKESGGNMNRLGMSKQKL